MAAGQTQGSSKISSALPNAEHDKFAETASRLGITVSALIRQLIEAFNAGEIKIPMKPAVMENYK